MSRTGNRSYGTWKSFERTIAKELGVWWCSDPKSFARIARSGAFPVKKSEGDIVPAKANASSFPFCVECKCRPSAFDREDLFGLLVASDSPLFSWWSGMNDVEVVYSRKKMRWLVVSIRSGKHLLFMGRPEWRYVLEHAGKPSIPTFRFDDGRDASKEDGIGSLFVCVFRDFLDWCDAESLGAPKPISEVNHERNCTISQGCGKVGKEELGCDGSKDSSDRTESQA